MTRAALLDARLEDDFQLVQSLEIVPTILEAVCRVTGMRFAVVARVTDERWIACEVLDQMDFALAPGGELPLDSTLCNEVRRDGAPIAIDHVSEHEQYRDHPTPRRYGLQSYVAWPIRRGGEFFGTLCAIDSRPADATSEPVSNLFRLFADLIGQHLDSSERLARSERELDEALETAELRDQFIAVLGHDLRNPLNTMKLGVQVLGTQPQSDNGLRMLEVLRRSTDRMESLVHNILDFARASFGGGFNIELSDEDLSQLLGDFVADVRTAHPDRHIDLDLQLDRPIRCDRSRLLQLVGNLLDNALVHGSPGAPVRIGAAVDDMQLRVWVINQGSSIPEEVRAGLFRPFKRRGGGTQGDGLGLGLFIADQIAQAQGGQLSLVPALDEIRFEFTLPLALQSDA